MLTVSLGCAGLPAGAVATGGAPDIRIEGKHFVDGDGQTLRLIGVNRAGAEYTCVQPEYGPDRLSGVFDGPVSQAAVATMSAWRINVVRVPLNEQCWLGVNPVRRGSRRIKPLTGKRARHAGEHLRRDYRRAVSRFVTRLHRQGYVVILDLHWSAPGRSVAGAQWPLPDRDHSPRFWRSVAETFRHDRSMVFDLFNEPALFDANFDSILSWSCLRDGCRVRNACTDCSRAETIPGCGRRCPTSDAPRGRYRTAGMQRLVDAVRRAGAGQPILVPGRYYSNDLGKWLAYRPRDPRGQVAASFHAYEGLPCDDESCWDAVLGPIARQVPIVTTEFGPRVDDDNGQPLPGPCDASFDTRYMSWADRNDIGYLAWWWHVEATPFGVPPSACTLSLLKGSYFSPQPRHGHGRAVLSHLLNATTP